KLLERLQLQQPLNGTAKSPEEAFEIAERIGYLATQARQPSPHYEHTEVGYNYRLSNLLAAFGLGQLETLQDRIERTRAIRDRYEAGLEDVPGISMAPLAPFGTTNAWLSSITLDPVSCRVDREQLRRSLEAANIEARPLWKPMHLQPLFERAAGRIDGTSEALFDIGLCLPSGSGMTEDEQARVIDAIRATAA
ncbi:MAG: DegT/DnrJ/EryC1/StrS family aminotransferase, partial [Actinomycetota bacterium]